MMLPCLRRNFLCKGLRKLRLNGKIWFKWGKTNKILCPNPLRTSLFPKKFSGLLKIMKCLFSRESVRSQGLCCVLVPLFILLILLLHSIFFQNIPSPQRWFKHSVCPLLSAHTNLFPPNVKKQDQCRGGVSVRNQNCRSLGRLTLQKNSSTHGQLGLHANPVPATLITLHASFHQCFMGTWEAAILISFPDEEMQTPFHQFAHGLTERN